MKTVQLTTEQKQSILNYLDSECSEFRPSVYINLHADDFSDFNELSELIGDNGGFEIDVVYHTIAIDYLAKNDPSLQTSLQIAHDLGYTVDSLNSELLASLLASENARTEFYDCEREVNNMINEFIEANNIN